ncbi:MAG: acyl-CoA dehydrogenase family protein [Candidatus Rokubacteria bacterium]|nr:acyl-CoA dehydrogenase family protein [Candidatus Rokubacteria bacterium]
MDFTLTPVEEAFRVELRDWLAKHLTDDLRVDDASDERVAGDRETFERRRVWQKKMYDAGWVGISWPKEYGGRGATLMQQVIFEEEYFHARGPVLPGYSGVQLAGPTIVHWGTEAQKKRHLPRILAAEDIWCQGYSEPGAGSDLASLRTRAEDKGDRFVINGQKVWTSGAHFADWIFMLARTNPDAPKHNGISYILVDMRTPGITVRPLVLMNGHRHFNEVFFDNVEVPKENLVGPMNQGWKVAITTLMYERSMGGGRGQDLQVSRLIAIAKSLKTERGTAWDDANVRQQLSQLAIECEALRLTRLRGLTRRLRGEAPGPEGSILKLYGSELGIRIADAAGALLGVRCLIDTPQAEVPDAPRWFNRVVSARQYTIAGGTSEIQRNIIGERVLGLPKG